MKRMLILTIALIFAAPAWAAEATAPATAPAAEQAATAAAPEAKPAKKKAKKAKKASKHKKQSDVQATTESKSLCPPPPCAAANCNGVVGCFKPGCIKC